MNDADTFVFMKNDDIGAASAEDDSQYLADCFVDTGDLKTLTDCESAKRIVIGRTGAGKTALLRELRNVKEHVIEISPHSLSLNFIADHGVIRFFEEAGVNLSLYYGLLWKHVFVVELLKEKFNIRNEESQRDCMRRIKNIVYKKDTIKEQAVDYFETWGDKFWLTTDQRIREITEMMGRRMTAAVEGDMPPLTFKAGGAETLQKEIKSEVVRRGQDVVSGLQIRELEGMIRILSEHVFLDPMEYYYITVDMLDEQWVDDTIKYRLIKAMIDTIRHFRRVPSVKIIAVLRQDLLRKVLYSTKEPGFQEEKYESLYLDLQWSDKELKRVIEKRLSRLVRRRYTTREVTYADLFPPTVDRSESFAYMLQRTFMRPRDIILFVNACIMQAQNSSKITSAQIKSAEEEYSGGRLQSLATEWLGFYPHLIHTCCLLRDMKESFDVADLTEDKIVQKFEREISHSIHVDHLANDEITRQINSLYLGTGNFNSVRQNLLRCFFEIGLIGIKPSSSSTVKWAYLSRGSATIGEIKGSSKVYIHPMFHRALNIHY